MTIIPPRNTMKHAVNDMQDAAKIKMLLKISSGANIAPYLIHF